MVKALDEHERTMAFAEVALGQIRSLRQTAIPRNYEIWYVYATGYNAPLNKIINETLARTVMTSLTLLVALLPLLLFGPASLFGMVAAITLGLFVGTYSSVYSAAPILVWLGVTSDSFVPRESAADEQEKKARGLV